MKQFFIGVFFIILNFSIFSQSSGLKIQSSDSIFFFLQLDEYESLDTAAISFEYFFQTSNPITGKIRIQSDSLNVIPFEVELSNGNMEIYDLTQIGSSYLVVPFLKSPLVIDTLKMRNNGVEEVSNFTSRRIQVIPSNTGCSSPYRDFEKQFQEIKSITFSFKKEKEITSLISNNCLYISQITKLIELIDYEDKKIRLIKQSYENTYDIDNFNTIKSLLLFEKYQTEFDAFMVEKSL